MKRETQKNKRLYQRLQKVISAALVVVMGVTTVYTQPAKASSSGGEALPNVSALPKLDPFKLEIPDVLGKVEEAYSDQSPKTVVLIQDAHAIEDAQKNIQKLIAYFQEEYGVRQVALEGAAGEIESQIFKSFPNQSKLKSVFKDYLRKGELTGGSAAALFNPTVSEFQGVEDWPIYEEGYRIYLRTLQNRPQIDKRISEWEARLEREKRQLYSPKLLTIDRVLMRFASNRGDLNQTLQDLAAVMPPEPESELALVLAETRRRGDDIAATAEVRWIAGKLRLECQKANKPGAVMKVFEKKFQEFQTDQLNTQMYALYLKEFVEGDSKLRDQVLKSLPDSFKKLSVFSGKARRLEAIEGTRFFKEFLEYADKVKGSLMTTDAQRWLNQESEEFLLWKRFSELKLDQADWEKIKQFKTRSSKVAARSAPGAGGNLPRSKVQLLTLFKEHFAFYENAKKRDEIMTVNVLNILERRGKVDGGWSKVEDLKAKTGDRRQATDDSIILVAGGFHTHGITRLLKEKGISYAVVMPAIKSLPDHTTYEAQMLGQVSWSQSFRVENGGIDLRAAFVRGTRDRLLSEGPADAVRSAAEDPRLLKNWRDQIIRDFAAQGRIEQAGDSTRFIDEIVSPNQYDPFRQQWLQNIKKFMGGMRDLDQRGQLNPMQVQGLLKSFSSLGQPAAYTQMAASVARITGVGLNNGGFVLTAPKSEVRQNVVYQPDGVPQGITTAQTELEQQVNYLARALFAKVKSRRPFVLPPEDQDVLNTVRGEDGVYVVETSKKNFPAVGALFNREIWLAILSVLKDERIYEDEGFGQLTIKGDVGFDPDDPGLKWHFFRSAIAKELAQEFISAGYPPVVIRAAAALTQKNLSDEKRLMQAMISGMKGDMRKAADTLADQSAVFSFTDSNVEEEYVEAWRAYHRTDVKDQPKTLFLQTRGLLMKYLEYSEGQGPILQDLYFGNEGSVMNRLKSELLQSLVNPAPNDFGRRSEVRSAGDEGGNERQRFSALKTFLEGAAYQFEAGAGESSSPQVKRAGAQGIFYKLSKQVEGKTQFFGLKFVAADEAYMRSILRTQTGNELRVNKVLFESGEDRAALFRGKIPSNLRTFYFDADDEGGESLREGVTEDGNADAILMDYIPGEYFLPWLKHQDE
ncbi:MAG: hypothetical protein KBC91_05875, partial [Candidatus Omnitrophica bacterium]|nr:hypothetical protein [Candidatus Omnitrophota bacterium]